MKQKEAAVDEISLRCQIFYWIASVKKLSFEAIYVGDG
jgi:hypothetical protein